MDEMAYWLITLPQCFLSENYYQIILTWIEMCNLRICEVSSSPWEETLKHLGLVLKQLQIYVESKQYDDQLEIFGNNFIRNKIFLSPDNVINVYTLNLGNFSLILSKETQKICLVHAYAYRLV